MYKKFICTTNELINKSYIVRWIEEWKDDIAYLEGEIQRLLDENSKLVTKSDVVLGEEIDAANKKAEDVISQYEEKISQLILDEIAFREVTEDKYIKARNDIQNQIADIDIKLVAESKDQQKIDSIDEEINQLERDFRAELGKIKTKQDKQLQELADDDNEIKALEDEMKPWINENSEYRQIIIEKYKDTQVYRIAQTFYKLEEGELISAEQIAKVSFFWFGSLATIVSIMGVVLAFGAFILKNTPPDGSKNRRGTGPIGRAFRKTLASRRKKYNAPKIKKVEVEKGQQTQILSAEHIILATGAKARTLKELEPDGDKIWTYKEAMVPEELPKSLLVIGSGAIGIEFASFYRDLGCEVTVVEMLDRILPQEDFEIQIKDRLFFLFLEFLILSEDQCIPLPFGSRLE